MNDEHYMSIAIELSKKAIEHGNEPFGAILVKDDEIVCTNENSINSDSDYTAHAELGLLRKFSKETGITDLRDYTLYTSCEPCFMCSGAMVWYNLGRLVYGASDIELCDLIGEKGAETSEITFSNFYMRPSVTKGILRKEALAVLKEYFCKDERM